MFPEYRKEKDEFSPIAIRSISALNWDTEEMISLPETIVFGSSGAGEEQPIVADINSRPVAANFKMLFFVLVCTASQISLFC